MLYAASVDAADGRKREMLNIARWRAQPLCSFICYLCLFILLPAMALMIAFKHVLGERRAVISTAFYLLAEAADASTRVILLISLSLHFDGLSNICRERDEFQRERRRCRQSRSRAAGAEYLFDAVRPWLVLMLT